MCETDSLKHITEYTFAHSEAIADDEVQRDIDR